MRKKRKNMKSQRRSWPLWASASTGLLVVLLALSLFQAFIAKQYAVSSGSMETTLATGDRVVVNRQLGTNYVPTAGDIIVFGATEDWNEQSKSPSRLRGLINTFGDLTGIGPSSTNAVVKRIVGVGGDYVECCSSDGRLIRNSQPIDETYIYEDYPFVPGALDCTTTPRSLRCFESIMVPSDSVFVLGDHRSISSDSAYRCRDSLHSSRSDCARFVRENDIKGRVFATIWPPGHLGIHSQISSEK